MEIYEHFYLVIFLFFVLFEIFDDAYEFGEEMVAKGLLIDIPIPVEVVAEHSSPIVAHLNSVNIHHRYDDPEDLTLYLLQLVQKPLHHPTTHTLAWMLSRHHYHCGPAVPLLVHQESVDLVAQHSLGQLYLLERQGKEKGGESQVSVGRLAAEFYLIEAMREVKVEFQAILDLFFLCFFLLILHIACNLLILTLPFFERLVKRFQSPSIHHPSLCEIMYNHRYALNIPIPNKKVVPLVVRFSIAVRPYIQVILLVLLGHVLQIAILEVGLKVKRILGPALDHLIIVVD